MMYTHRHRRSLPVRSAARVRGAAAERARRGLTICAILDGPTVLRQAYNRAGVRARPRVVRGPGLLKLIPHRKACPRGHAAAARPSRTPPSAHAPQSRAISATAPVADGVGQEGLRGQPRPHEPLEMASTCPSQPTVGAGVTTTGGTAPLHKVGITAHRKEQEAPSRGLATFLSSTHKGGSPHDCPAALRRKAGGDGTNRQRWQSELVDGGANEGGRSG